MAIYAGAYVRLDNPLPGDEEVVMQIWPFEPGDDAGRSAAGLPPGEVVSILFIGSSPEEVYGVRDKAADMVKHLLN